MAAKKDDPTVTSGSTGEAAEGTHPARPIEQADDSATSFKYRDMPDERKPDPSTIAQEQVLPEDK